MRKATVTASFVAVLLPGLAGAQVVQNIVLRNSFNPVGAGARGLGMGGAFIAVADDGTASSFNPAGLAQLRRSELALVGFSHELRSRISVPEFDDPAEELTDKSRHQAPDFGGLAVPFEVGGRSLTIQLSYQRTVDLFGRGTAVVQDIFGLQDLDPEAPTNPDVSFSAVLSPEQKGAFHTVSLAAGYQATSRLALGASLNYWIGEWNARGGVSSRVTIATSRGRLPLFSNELLFEQDQSLRALNLNLGFLLHYPRISIGGVLRLPFTGDYDLTEVDTGRLFDIEAGEQAVYNAVDVATRLHWPRVAGVGVALRPVSGLTLAGDYARAHWSRAFIEDVPTSALLTGRFSEETGAAADVFTDRNFFDLLPASQTATADTDQWRAGAEYLVPLPKVIVPLRGGIFRDRSPVTELGSGIGRQIEGWTVGTGLNFSRLVLDVAYERRESAGVIGLRSRRGEPAERGNPTESVTEDRFVASVIYRFGDDDPIKRALRYLFVGKEEGE